MQTDDSGYQHYGFQLNGFSFNQSVVDSQGPPKSIWRNAGIIIMDKTDSSFSSVSRACGNCKDKLEHSELCSTGETPGNISLHTNSTSESKKRVEKKCDYTKFEVVDQKYNVPAAGSMNSAFFQVPLGRSGKLIFSCVPRADEGGEGGGDSRSPQPDTDHDHDMPPSMISFGSQTTMKFSITAWWSLWLTQEDGRPARFIAENTSTVVSLWRHNGEQDLRYVVVDGSYDNVKKACSWLMLCITFNTVFSVYPFAVSVYTGIPCLMEHSLRGCSSGEHLCSFSHSNAEQILLPSQNEVISDEGRDKTASLHIGKHERLMFSCAPPDSSSSWTKSLSQECHATIKFSIRAMWADSVVGQEGATAREVSALTGTILSVWKHKVDPGIGFVVLDGSYENVIVASSLIYQTLVNCDLIPPEEC